MDNETWQQLLSLESRDIVEQWFFRIHARKLSVRRAKEINAAAKQSREYFKNASNSSYSVRPVLAYYGVASLSRSLCLLLNKSGGEEILSPGHGLKSNDWARHIVGQKEGSSSLLNLEIQTASGLFSDLIQVTNNLVAIHVNSERVDWRINYHVPLAGQRITLGDLFARIPDLHKDYKEVSNNIKYARVNEISFNQTDGFKAKVKATYFEPSKDAFEAMGYAIETRDNWTQLTCDTQTFKNCPPLFVHSYVQKAFDAIPDLFIAEPFLGKFAYSQIGLTFLCAYFLGMLARYFPTQWVSLIQGDRGDALWPSLNRAQQFVELTYPEIVIELIYDVLQRAD